MFLLAGLREQEKEFKQHRFLQVFQISSVISVRHLVSGNLRDLKCKHQWKVKLHSYI